MRIVRMRAVGSLGAVLCLVSGGCTKEAWQWGQPNSSGSENPQAGVKARRPADNSEAGRDPRTARAGSGAAAPDDTHARDVQDRVSNYARTVQARYDSSLTSNDFNAKIARHNDPEYRRRIRQTALAAYERTAADDDPPHGSAEESAGASPSRTDHGSADHSAAEPPAVSGRSDVGERTSAVDESSRARAKNDTAAPSHPVGTAAQQDDRARTERGSAGAAGGDHPSDSRRPIEGGSGTTGEGMTASRAPAASPDVSAETRPPVLAGTRTTGDGAADAPPGRSEEVSAPKDAPGTASGPGPRVIRPPAEPADASRAGGDSTDSPKSGEIASNQPMSAAPVIVDTLRQRIAELEAQVAREPNNLDAQMRLRMLYLSVGEDGKALEATEGMDDDKYQLVSSCLRLMKAARSDLGRDPAAWANEQLPAIEALREGVRAQADLRVPKIVLCESIDAYGVYDPIEPPEFVAGQSHEALLYIEVDNYSSEKTASGYYRTVLAMRLSVMDRGGRVLWTAPQSDNIEDLSRERRRDFFLTYDRLRLPKGKFPAGTYVLKVEVEDVLAQKTNSSALEFKLVQP